MLPKRRYQTKQRGEILSFLKRQSGSHVTAAQVHAYLQEQGNGIGLATVYRTLERLADDKIVNKYIVESQEAATFELAVGKHQQERSAHFKCMGCGMLMHLDCQYIQQLQTHLMDHHDLAVLPEKTMFYGHCSSCRTE